MSNDVTFEEIKARVWGIEPVQPEPMPSKKEVLAELERRIFDWLNSKPTWHSLQVPVNIYRAGIAYGIIKEKYGYSYFRSFKVNPAA